MVGDGGGKISKADMVPLYMIWGFVALAVTFAVHTGKQHVAHNPGVRFSKKRRGTMAEVTEPERVLGEADKFLNKSLLRRVAHLQDFDAVRSGTQDPTRADPFSTPKTAETPKGVVGAK